VPNAEGGDGGVWGPFLGGGDGDCDGVLLIGIGGVLGPEISVSGELRVLEASAVTTSPTDSDLVRSGSDDISLGCGGFEFEKSGEGKGNVLNFCN